MLDNSAWDAQTYSVTGNQVDKPAYANARVTIMLGGPLEIPQLLSGHNGTFTFNYQLTRSRNGITQTTTMPTALERGGDFSQSFAQGPVTIYDPLTGNPFPGNIIPRTGSIRPRRGCCNIIRCPISRAPTATTRRPSPPSTTSDNINVAPQPDAESQEPALAAASATRAATTPRPTSSASSTRAPARGMNYNANLSPQLHHPRDQQPELPLQPLAESHQPVLREPPECGGKSRHHRRIHQTRGTGGRPTSRSPTTPASPTALPSLTRNQTSSVGESLIWVHGVHNMTFGADYRRQQINPLSDPNARGKFTFTGNTTSQIVNGVAVQGTGFDFADFLLGRPDTSAVRYGNARPLFPHLGLRRLHDRRLAPEPQVLAQLRRPLGLPDAASPSCTTGWSIWTSRPAYAAIAPVLPGQIGRLSGLHYTDSLVKPDKNNFSPRIGFAWRPVPQTVHGDPRRLRHCTTTPPCTTPSPINMAQQPPFAQTFSVAIIAGQSAHRCRTASSAGHDTSSPTPTPSIPTTASATRRSGRSPCRRIWAIRWSAPSLRIAPRAPASISSSCPTPRRPGPRRESPARRLHLRAGQRQFDLQLGARSSLMRRFRNGISGNISYMFSKAIDNAASALVRRTGWTPRPSAALSSSTRATP